VLVALSFLLLASGRGEASCGDWLDGHRFPDPQGVLAGDVTPSVDGQAGSAALADAPRPPRCDGPACRGIPSVPALPLEASFDLSSHDPADRSGLAVVTANDLDRPLPVEADRKPASVIDAVPTRPPRRASLQA